MVIDFSKVDLHERPVIMLKDVSGKKIGTLGYAKNITADIKYNESSVLEFSLPAMVDGVPTPHYDDVVGMRVIEVEDIGQFILVNPSETDDGLTITKACKAYSLEFELTFKNITIENGTYNFWNPVTPDSTVLGMVMAELPSWSIGTVDSGLVGKYRTFEVAGENIYNFMKNTLQQTFGCIFEFDTFNRKVSVRDVNNTVPVNPVYISSKNLAKSIVVTENTEEIVTRLDVSGSDGVNIRDVNPMGTNYIINLDYYMTPANFSQEIIDKYNAWKTLYSGYQRPYYNLTVEYALQIMRRATEQAKLTDLNGELSVLEVQQATIIQAIARGIKTQADLDAINVQIHAKEDEINAKKAEIETITQNINSIYAELQQINKETNFQSYFTTEEYKLLDRYIKDDALQDSTFVFSEVGEYLSADYGNKIGEPTAVSVAGAKVDATIGYRSKDIYNYTGGRVKIADILDAEIIRGSFEKKEDGEFIFTAYLNTGSLNGEDFPTACVSMTGSCTGFKADDTSLSFRGVSGYIFITHDTTEYEKRSVAWDLFDYANDVLQKVSQPSFTFTVDSANFLSLDEFIEFKNKLRHGDKIYIGISEDETLTPILIGAHFTWDNIQELTLEFGNKYLSGDSSFLLADLLEQSISMGKSFDAGKFSYSAFIESGANTRVKEFIDSALDVSKNAILSTKNQAISWGDSGIRLRQWANEEHTAYEPHQVWMNNNSIMMTSNNWATAEMAIGYFHDTNIGDCWGVVAPNIVGTLLAGNNLVIESAKKDGGTSVFRVDGEGCVLYNSTFDIVSNNKRTHISLDPELGIAIGNYPVYTISSSGKRQIDLTKAKFWADTDGNLHLNGRLHAATGDFDGKITAREGYIGDEANGWTIGNTFIYNGKSTFGSSTEGIYIGTDGISMGTNNRYIRASRNGVLSANDVVLSGNITATSGDIGGCSIVNGQLNVDAANIKTGYINEARIPNLSANKITTGTMSADRISGGHIDARTTNIQNLNASNITSGTIDASNIKVININADNITAGNLNTARINGMDASKITSGTFSSARIPDLSADKLTTGTLNGNKVSVKYLNADSVTAGTFNASRIPNLTADKLTSGTIDASKITVKNLNASNITTGSLSADRIKGGTITGCSINIGSGTFSVNTSGEASMNIRSLKVFSSSAVGKLGYGYHTGQTFSMTVMRSAYDTIQFVFVQGVCCGYTT